MQKGVAPRTIIAVVKGAGRPVSIPDNMFRFRTPTPIALTDVTGPVGWKVGVCVYVCKERSRSCTCGVLCFVATPQHTNHGGIDLETALLRPFANCSQGQNAGYVGTGPIWLSMRSKRSFSPTVKRTRRSGFHFYDYKLY